MSFEPDDQTHEQIVQSLLSEQSTLLKAILIVLCEMQDEEPQLIIDDAEQI